MSSLAYLKTTPDATITFTSKVTNRNLFSYELESNECDPDKYDFITVAIQAIGKALGFVLRASNSNQQLIGINPTNTFTKKYVVI